MVPQEQEIFTAYEQTGQESVISATASVWQERRAAEKQLKERVQSVLDTYGCCVAGSLIPDTEKFGMLPEKLMEDLLYLADEILIEADGSVLRLKDVATIEFDSEDYNKIGRAHV